MPDESLKFTVDEQYQQPLRPVTVKVLFKQIILNVPKNGKCCHYPALTSSCFIHLRRLCSRALVLQSVHLSYLLVKSSGSKVFPAAHLFDRKLTEYSGTGFVSYPVNPTYRISRSEERICTRFYKSNEFNNLGRIPPMMFLYLLQLALLGI